MLDTEGMVLFVRALFVDRYRDAVLALDTAERLAHAELRPRVEAMQVGVPLD